MLTQEDSMKKLLYILIPLGILGYIFFFTPSTDEDLYFYDEEAGYVYETEVSSIDECTELEQYDEESSICYFECDTEEECIAIEEEIDKELGLLGDEYFSFSQDFQEFDGDVQELEEQVEVSYSLEKGEVFVLTEGTENDAHIKIRKWLAGISPDKFSDNYLNRLVIYSEVDGDTAAYVEKTDTDKWDMFVNVDVLRESEKEMVFTLVHEFAHILTLNSSQLNEEVGESDCAQHYVEEGCLYKSSYFNSFWNMFWKDGAGGGSFVTDYASTDAGEDIAESFSFFVFEKKKDPTTIAEEKTIFFYEYSDLVGIRESIRSVLTPFVRKRLIDPRL